MIEENSPKTRTPQLILCAATVLKATFEARVKAAKYAGFDAITLFPQQYLNARHREKLSVADMAAILRDHDIVLDTVDPLLDWFSPVSSPSENLLFDIAVALDAKAINVAPAFAPDMEQAELVGIFVGLCERAAKHGLRVDLEVLPWTIVPSYPVAFKLLQAAAQSNAGITFDCLHFYRSGGSISELAQLSPQQAQLVSNIQLCDIPASPASFSFGEKVTVAKEMLVSAWDSVRVMGLKSMISVTSNAHATRPDSVDLMREASYSRVLPGQGDIPLADIINTLRGSGAYPDIGPEIFSLALNKLAPNLAAEKAMDSYRNLALA